MYNNYGPPPPQVQQPSYYGPPLQQQQEYNGPELEQGYQEEEKEEASSTESSSAATKPAGAGEKTSAKPWRKKIPLKSIHGATGGFYYKAKNVRLFSTESSSIFWLSFIGFDEIFFHLVWHQIVLCFGGL